MINQVFKQMELIYSILHLPLSLMELFKTGTKNHVYKPSKRTQHCVKSVRVRSYSGPHFPAFFRLNTERYSLSLCIQSKCGKMRTRITSNTGAFYAVWEMGTLKSRPLRIGTLKVGKIKTRILTCRNTETMGS